jgi:hypothetical protein
MNAVKWQQRESDKDSDSHEGSKMAIAGIRQGF